MSRPPLPLRSFSLSEEEESFYVIHDIVVRHLGHVPIAKGDFHLLPIKVKRFIALNTEILRPRGIYICDGSQSEADEITQKLIARGMLSKLKYENCYICRTDPKDVARVEGKTWITTKDKYATVPHSKDKCVIGQWMSPEDAERELNDRLTGSMSGRMLYVIPFSMGPLGSPLSKIGVQLTDSNYVVLSMRIMTRVSPQVWDILGDGDFVRCVHSMGRPRPVQELVISHWPCNPDRIMISHIPEERKVYSYGSGYGGNSLLGKKCFALRIASCIAKDEGWLAEHMLIMSVTNPKGEEKFIAAAFPSACGKTNLAMMLPTLPGFKVRCVGDDIAWMRFDEQGQLRAINPEAGFFGVAPGTSSKTNPIAMETVKKNCIFTNVAQTEDGGFFWEGMEDELEDINVEMINWLNEKWKIGMPGRAAQANSRFCCPAGQCPIIHPLWEDPKGVPIHAIVFGGRRPEGVPLLFESLSWSHGVFVGAALKSESTAAAEFTGKTIMHDPMAMRPFMGYNFGHYLQHWLDLEKPPHILPKVFHVNWFLTTKTGKFLWPGFGENIRVLDWICRRVNGENIAVESPIGFLPKKDSINVEGLKGPIDMDQLLSVPKEYWIADSKETRQFLQDQLGSDLPQKIKDEMLAQEKRIESMV